jgi:peptidoglycan/LPS O-acetylase OafA/YrhL
MATQLNKIKSHTPSWLDAWHVNPSVNREYDFIDGLRGVAILMVVTGHYFYINPKADSFMHFIGGMIATGGYGVTLFFALSGFLISWPFWKRKVNHATNAVPPGYGWRRFWKIYTPLALSIIVLTPIYIFRMHDWSFLIIAMQWLCGSAFLTPISNKLNGVMWSLVVEVQFYLLLPSVFLFTKRLSPKFCLWIITIVFLLAPVLTHVVMGFSPVFYPEINSYFPSALDSFYLGILIAGLENMGALKKSWSRLGDLGFAILLAVVLAAGWFGSHSESSVVNTYGMRWLAKIAAGCLLCYVANPQNPRARLLCAPWLRWCGIISYEWYLFHQPMINWTRQGYGSAGGNLFKYALIIGVPLLISLFFSAMVYRYFSLPILKYGRGKH